MLWLLLAALAALLCVQIHIATADTITIPPALIHEMEKHLADRGLRCTFGAISCDTKGRVLVSDLALYPASHTDPVLTARTLRFQVNPYALIMRAVMPRAGSVEGLSLRLPAMLSDTGANSPLIDNLDAEIELRATQLIIRTLTARAGNLAISTRGAISLPAASRDAHPHATLLADIMRAYLQTARHLSAILVKLDTLERPLLDITLKPSARHIATATIAFQADSLHIAANDAGADAPTHADARTDAHTNAPPPRLALGPLTANTALEISALIPGKNTANAALRIHAATTDATLPAGALARDARVSARLPIAQLLQTLRDLAASATAPAAPAAANAADAAAQPLPVDLALTLGTLTARDITAHALAAHVTGRYPQNLRATLNAIVLDEPAELETEADLAAKTATLRLATNAGAQHIAALARELRFPPLTDILRPARPIAIDATAHLAPGWKFTTATGSLDIGPILAQRVHIDRARGDFAYDHATRTITFSPALAATGDSIARGSYQMNFSTLDYRFLLAGRLRPPAIAGWFGKWWPAFWDDYQFAGPPPHGDVDVRGNWKHPRLSTVFVAAHGAQLSLKHVALDHVQLTLFTRPDFFDALELVATRGAGNVRGAFTNHVVDPGNRLIETRLAFQAANIDPSAIAPAIHPQLVTTLAPLQFAAPPALIAVTGTITGPASPLGAHTAIDIDAQGAGPFSYEGLPLETLSTAIKIRDDLVSFERFSTQFAGGHLDFNAKISGPGDQRRLGADANIRGASLGNALYAIAAYKARKRGAPAEHESKYHQQLANARIDARISLDGLYDDPLSFTGNGSTEITGPELININLLGALSHVLRGVPGLNITSLNFNAAQSNFILKGRELELTQANITGPRAKVNIKGLYRLDSNTASLTAKVYPLSESRNILGAAVGFLLTPVTSILELKLDGPLDAPKWRFSYGPTSLFRSISGKSAAEPKPVHPGPEQQQTPPAGGQSDGPEK